MTNFNKMLLVAGATMLFATPALAAPSATSVTLTVSTRAQIVEPLTMTKLTDLDFGTLVKTSTLTATPVTFSLANDNTPTCPAELLCSNAQTATFDVFGTPDQFLFVTTSATLLNNGLVNLAMTPNPVTGQQLDSTGKTSFGVGGTVQVASTTAAGVYNGTMDVTVDYN